MRDGQLALYPGLYKKGYLEIWVRPEGTFIQAKGHIGLIPVNDRLTLEILPRVPLTNLSRLLQISGEAPATLVWALRRYETAGQMYPTLAAVYAAGLRRVVEHVVTLGLLKDYTREEELTATPTGRIEIGRTLNRATMRGITHRAAVSYFQRSPDNPVNRCLLYAVWSLRHYVDQVMDSLDHRQRRSIHSDLNYAWHLLQGIHLDRDEGFLADPVVRGEQMLPVLRSYYRPALDLALTVIGREAILVERGGSRVQLPSLVVDMSVVFEVYLLKVLTHARRKRGWPLVVLDGNLRPPAGGAGSVFKSGIAVEAKPDVVLRKHDGVVGACTLVIEVKYKPAGRKPAREDLNQAITYAVAYGAPRVIIVQPRAKGSAIVPGLRLLGEVADVEVYQYVVDLAARSLEGEEAAFATAVEGLGLSA